MDWEADVHIAGPVGSMGQRVLQPIVNQQVQHVLAALDEQVQQAARAAPASRATLPAAAAAAGTGAEPEAPATPAGDSTTTASRRSDPIRSRTAARAAPTRASALAPETYEPEPEGPTTSTED